MSGFLASWELFATTYAVALLIAATLSLVGVWLVARDQVFFGVAVAQASTFGVALALWLGGAALTVDLGWLESEVMPAVFAVAASILTAWLVARGSDSTLESQEAITGWVFLSAASVPVLLMAHSPHGLEEVHRLMFSTLLSVSQLDLVLFGILAGATAAAVWRFHEPLMLLAMDGEMAAAVGLGRRAWNGTLAVWLGLSVGLAIRASGMLYTFGCLVLPALIAKNLTREVRPMLWIAPAVATVACGVGLWVAHVADLPPAHATIATLCAWLPLAWLRRAARSRGAPDSPAG